jgi:hypothetical protein
MQAGKIIQGCCSTNLSHADSASDRAERGNALVFSENGNKLHCFKQMYSQIHSGLTPFPRTKYNVASDIPILRLFLSYYL